MSLDMCGSICVLERAVCVSDCVREFAGVCTSGSLLTELLKSDEVPVCSWITDSFVSI